MEINPRQKGIGSIAAIGFILCFFSFSFAQEKSPAQTGNRGIVTSGEVVDEREESFQKADYAKPKAKSEAARKAKSEKPLTVLQEQARVYRDEALEFQRIGNMDAALTFFQKAVELDPSYALIYNDLGIIYEAQGLIGRAEENYLTCLRLDPDNLGAYSNLALLYENQRDLKKAVFYWQKRAQLGLPDDPWTQKAKNRLKDLAEVVPGMRENRIEQETMRLANDVVLKKNAQKQQAQDRCALAKQLMKAGDYTKASDELYNVLSLDPQNREAPLLMDQIQRKLMEDKKNSQIKEMQAHFKEGLKSYEQDDFQKAKQEFDKVNELAASPQK